MKHSILPPHLTEHLARTRPGFRDNLRHDAGIRHVRARTPSVSDPGGITVYDAENSMALPGQMAEEDLPQAERIRRWAQATTDVLEVSDFPGGVVRYGTDYANAFYDGRYLVFGMGDGEIFKDFTLGLDVFAHEFAHRLIESGPGLEYAGQAGALNEHLADVIGVSVREAGKDQEEHDWRIGAELFIDGTSALRDMARPGQAYDNDLLGRDPQVGHMDDYVETFLDNGGVHINSGIPNRAFTHFAQKVGGPLHRIPLHIWMKAGNKAGPRTDFGEFAAFTAEVAGEHRKAVIGAWAEVGITVDTP